MAAKIMKTYHVYIMSNVSKMLYTGVTNNIEKRVFQHKAKQVPGFTQRYNLFRLVHVEPYSDIRDAIAREKQIKALLRAKKVALIELRNPKWDDIAAELVHETEQRQESVILRLSDEDSRRTST